MVRVDADAGEGEFRHVGPADQGRAGLAQAGHGGSIARGQGGAGERGRAGAGRLAGNVEQVLDRHGQPGERAGVASFGHGLVGARRDPAGQGKARHQERVDAGRRPGCSDRLLDQIGGAGRSGQDAGPGVSQVGAHRRCYNRVLCSERTNGRIHRFGEAAFFWSKDSRTGSFKVLRSAISDPGPGPLQLRDSSRDSRTNLWILDDDLDA